MRKALILSVAAVLTIVAWAPVLGVAVASWVAGRAGCQLDEGSVHPCPIGPFDVGGLLYSLGVSGWLFLSTWPLAIASVVFWVGYGLLAIVRAVRRR